MSFLLAQKDKIKWFYPQRHFYLAAHYVNSIATLWFMLQSSSEFWRHWHICKKWILRQRGFVELNMKRNNAISTELLVLFILYGVQYKSQLICVSLISMIKFSTFVVLQNILMTPYDCDLYYQTQKYCTRDQENCAEELHTWFLLIIFRVFLGTAVPDKVATPAGFTSVRMKNSNFILW